VVRVDLGERHEGHAEPDHVPVRPAVLLAASALLAAGCGASGRGAPPHPPAGGHAPPAPVRKILLASGRDDHGLRTHPHVRLLSAPDVHAEARAAVPDGALVRLLDMRGDWLRVRALERRGAVGWVNDFWLRGTVHLLDRSTCTAALAVAPGTRSARKLERNVQAELLGAAHHAGATWLRVRTIPAQRIGWVRARAVHELPDRGRCA
jgi:hypothetical protein